jgi:hypothetical protein
MHSFCVCNNSYAKHGTAENVLLTKRLFSSDSASDLRRVVQMAVDTAAGLAYMHSEQPPVIHRSVMGCRVLRLGPECMLSAAL